jgi:uncharacterized protein YkwD
VFHELFLLSGMLTSGAESVPLASLPSAETEKRIALNITDPRGKDHPAAARALLRDLNNSRIANGLAPLTLEPRLCEIARAHALDMAEHKYFGHNSLDGATPFERMLRAGYEYRSAGENLALDVDEPSAARMLWRSNGHRSNMLEPHFGRVGVAAVSTDAGEIFVEDFSD